MKKTIFLTLTMVFMLAISGMAQNYTSAVGARLGRPFSASYKTFINESNAVEGIVGFRSGSGYNWVTINGAYQIHKPIDAVDGLNYYYGAGAGVYFWSFDNDLVSDSKTSIGLQGYLGLDYTFPDSPINLTVDWVPTFLLNGFNNGFGADGGSLGVRYVLGR